MKIYLNPPKENWIVDRFVDEWKKNNKHISYMKITYAICVCTESRELNDLLNFLTHVKDEEDDINILVDSSKVTMMLEMF